MTKLFILRHGPTDWNRAKRLQGRSDIALSEEGRYEVNKWRIPQQFEGFEWVTSPLIRAVETARLLGHDAKVEASLTEMFWGDWEGMIWQELLSADDPELDANRARGLDFRPKGGESPREVQQRLSPWLGTLTGPTVAVSHKGVLQALYALATGWQMTDKSPDKILNACAHLFEIEQGKPVLLQMNISLEDNR